jgi:PAS domain S-box-containing protein
MAESRSGLVVANPDGVILLWAGDAEALTGHEAGAVVGHTLDVIVPPEYRERHWSGFGAAIATGTARAEGAAASIPVLCADGSLRRLPGRFTLLRDARGQAAGAAAVFVEPRSDDPPLFEL